jgi:type II secretory pathway component PulC
MAENNSSAEYELLRTIEGKTSLASRNRFVQGDAKDKLVLTLAEWKKKFSQLDLRSGVKLSDMNRVMAVLVMALVVFQIGVIARGLFRISNVPTFDASTALKATGEPRLITFPLRDYSHYLDVFMGRNIFLGKVDDEETAQVSEASLQEDAFRNLRLTGISWMEETGERFAMVEDIEAKVTHYLQEQETLRGFTIEAIGTNKVILKKDGREVELR